MPGARTHSIPRRLFGAGLPAVVCFLGVVAAVQETGVAAAGQETPSPPAARVVAQPAGAACAGPGWVVRDDGTPENGLGWDPNVVSDGTYVDRFDLGPPGGDAVTRVCLRLARLGSDSSLDFDVTFWTLDGPGGDPNTLLGSVPATATGVPSGLPGQLYEVDVSGLGLPAQGMVGVGPRWNPQVDQDFFLLTDEGLASPFTDPMGSSDGGASWDNVVNALPNTQTTMVRVEQGPDLTIFSDGFESGDTSIWSLTTP